MENKEYKVNLDELKKQRETSIKKTNEYCEVKILIGKGERTPIADIVSKGVTPLEVALMIKSLKETYESMIKFYPLAYEISQHIKMDKTEID